MCGVESVACTNKAGCKPDPDAVEEPVKRGHSELEFCLVALLESSTVVLVIDLEDSRLCKMDS